MSEKHDENNDNYNCYFRNRTMMTFTLIIIIMLIFKIQKTNIIKWNYNYLSNYETNNLELDIGMFSHF